MAQGAGPDPSERPPAEAGLAASASADTIGPEPPFPLTFAPTVTLFFSDIRGFTEYTDAHGDAAAFRMLQFHNTMVQEQIALYGGHIVKTLGDSYMVSFNAARNAMACGIGIQKSLALYNDKESGAKIHIGIGINMGEPILDADDFFGGSVNLAARICAAAGPGEILVSEGVRHVVGKMEGTDYIDRGHFDLKGFQEPQHLYAVDWSGLGTSDRHCSSGLTLHDARSNRPAGAATTVTLARCPEPAVEPPADRARGRRAGRGRADWRLPGACEPAGSGRSGMAAAKPGVAKPAASRRQSRTGSATPRPPSTPPRPDREPAGCCKPAASPNTGSGRGEPGRPAPRPARPPRRGGSSAPTTSPIPLAACSPNNLQGIARITGDGSAPLDFEGNYAYQGGALVGKLVGDHPGGDRAVFGRMLLAAGTVAEDFAVEVRARVTELAACDPVRASVPRGPERVLHLHDLSWDHSLQHLTHAEPAGSEHDRWPDPGDAASPVRTTCCVSRCGVTPRASSSTGKRSVSPGTSR